MANRQSGGKCMNQMGVSELEFAGEKKRTRRERTKTAIDKAT